MNRTFYTSGLPCRALVSFFLLFRNLLALALCYLHSELPLEKFDRFLLVYPVALAYLGALAASPRYSVARPNQDDVYVHTENAYLRVVFRAGDVDVLVHAKGKVAKVVKRGLFEHVPLGRDGPLQEFDGLFVPKCHHRTYRLSLVDAKVAHCFFRAPFRGLMACKFCQCFLGLFHWLAGLADSDVYHYLVHYNPFHAFFHDLLAHFLVHLYHWLVRADHHDHLDWQLDRLVLKRHKRPLGK